MGKCTFKGGVHPYDGKEFSKDKPVKELFPAQGEMVFPLSQHIGAPAVPVVAKGDYVLAGQLIAEAGGFVSANIHSSVSGTVKAIEPRTLATGGKCNAIIIENDGEYKEVEYTPAKLEDLSRDEIRERIKAAGVVGMGGAGFPTNVKLTPKNPENIDYIIVNGAECEPYLTSDYRRLLEESDKVVMGLKVALKLFDHAKGIIGIEDNKPEAIRIMKEKTANEPDIEVKELKTKYPQGGERCLIYATTGRSINSSMLPADAGCIVHNVDTIYSIYMAVIEGKPLTKRIVTVTGDGVKEPGNFYVWLGTNYRQLLEAAGGPVGEPEKYISGGPMMGFAMYSLDVPVVKGSSSLLVFKEDVVSKLETSACIRCGRCGDGCPSHLLPAKLAGFASRNDEAGFLKFDGMECVECGSCSYVCPAKRPLTQQIKSMRRTIMANRGIAHMGIGRASGENKAEVAAKMAILCPLLDTTIEGAMHILIIFCGAMNLGLMETEEAAELIREAIDPEAEIIFGTTLNEELNDEVVVTVIATGLEDEAHTEAPARRSFAETIAARGERAERAEREEEHAAETEETSEEPAQEDARPAARRFADLDYDYESEIKIPDFLTRKKF